MTCVCDPKSDFCIYDHLLRQLPAAATVQQRVDELTIIDLNIDRSAYRANILGVSRHEIRRSAGAPLSMTVWCR